MGARTTWQIKTETGNAVTWLYSHWGGENKLSDTKRALREARPRWSDTPYGARIFISQIVGNDWERETGYGITTGEENNPPFEEEYDYVKVDFTTQTITYGAFVFSFGNFVELEANTILVEYDPTA